MWRAQDDHAGPRIGVRFGDGGAQRVERPRVVVAQHVPAIAAVALGHVLGERQGGVALDRDVVVVVEARQPAEAEVPGDRRRLPRDALLQVAVGADAVRAVVDDLVPGAVVASGQHALGQRHADRVPEALPERPGGRLDARRVVHLRVARRLRPPLPERLQIVDRQVVAGQVQRGVLEDAGVARRQHEPVAVRPVRVARVVPHILVVEQVRDGREGHGVPGCPEFAFCTASMASVRMVVIDSSSTEGIWGISGSVQWLCSWSLGAAVRGFGASGHPLRWMLNGPE